jgi:hypothetical protein
MHRLQELVRLHRLGLTERRAAKELRMGRNTAKEYRRAIAAAGLLDGSVEDLPPLETLKAIVVAALPPRPAPQQVSKLSWRSASARRRSTTGSGSSIPTSRAAWEA